MGVKEHDNYYNLTLFVGYYGNAYNQTNHVKTQITSLYCSLYFSSLPKRQ